MHKPNAPIVMFILVLIVAVAAWSKLRYASSPAFDEPQRWRVDQFSRFRDDREQARCTGRQCPHPDAS
jgi:hypothetical protein